MTEALKRCGKCGEEKPLSEFNRRASCADGLNRYCRQCVVGPGQFTLGAAFHCFHCRRPLVNKNNGEIRRALATGRKMFCNSSCCADSMRHTEEALQAARKVRFDRWVSANPGKARENAKRYYQANPERYVQAARRWQAANPEKFAEHVKRTSAKARLNLSPAYVAVTLGMPVSKLTPELIEAKRQQLLLYRAIKALQTAAKAAKEKRDGEQDVRTDP